MQTVEQAASKFVQRLKELQKVPEPAIAAAHNHIMAAIPVYTGTYQDSVELRKTEGGAAVLVSPGGLAGAAGGHAGDILDMAIPHGQVTPSWYVGGSPTPTSSPPFFLMPGGGAYIERIEASASPLGEGQGAWRDASRMAKEIINETLKRIAGGSV